MHTNKSPITQIDKTAAIVNVSLASNDIIPALEVNSGVGSGLTKGVGVGIK